MHVVHFFTVSFNVFIIVILKFLIWSFQHIGYLKVYFYLFFIMYYIFASFIVIIFPMSDIMYFKKNRLKCKYLLKK